MYLQKNMTHFLNSIHAIRLQGCMHAERLTCARNNLCAKDFASVLRVWCFSNKVSILLVIESTVLMIRIASTTMTWLVYCSTRTFTSLLQYTLSL